MVLFFVNGIPKLLLLACSRGPPPAPGPFQRNLQPLYGNASELQRLRGDAWRALKHRVVTDDPAPRRCMTRPRCTHKVGAGAELVGAMGSWRCGFFLAALHPPARATPPA